MDKTKNVESLIEEMLRHMEDAGGGPLAEDVAEAMRAVPRHVFVPQVPLEQAYSSSPVVTHRDADGVPISSASAPGTVAGMLEQAEVKPGHRVLEIGSGTGYNAALLNHLVGPEGAVTTIEYDPQVADAARAALASYGAERVRVVTGDGTLGAPEDGPFDRILVTAGAWDVTPAWREQLAPGGRLVLPLRLNGLTRVTAFEHDGDGLRSVSADEDGFIPMKGIGAVVEQTVRLGPGPDVTLNVDDNQPVNAEALADALGNAPETVWTGIEAPWAWTENLDLWLAKLPGFCRMFVNADAVSAGRVPRPKEAWGGSWGIFSENSLAYLTSRRVGGVDEMPMLQIGACGFGPEGAQLAQQLADRVTTWRQDTEGRIEVIIHARPTNGALTNDEEEALVVVEKTDHVFVVTIRPRTVDAAA
ncbi:hypothetical protein GCM10027059_38420 [Myceligenerans halotolerans]